MTKPYVVIPDDNRPEALDVLGTKVTVLGASSENDCYGLTFQQGPEGSGPPPHSHDWDEAFFVLSGTINFQCDGDSYACTPGTLVHVPRNTVHAFSYSEGGGSMLEITSKDGHAAEMFTQVSEEIDPENPDIPKTLGILRAHGVTVG